jgi:hypothetical protein
MGQVAGAGVVDELDHRGELAPPGHSDEAHLVGVSLGDLGHLGRLGATDRAPGCPEPHDRVAVGELRSVERFVVGQCRGTREDLGQCGGQFSALRGLPAGGEGR